MRSERGRGAGSVPGPALRHSSVKHGNNVWDIHGKDATARGLGGWRDAGCRAAARSRGRGGEAA